jgi:hypothetical protein
MRRARALTLASAIAAVAVIAMSGVAQAAWQPVTDPLGSGTPNGSITLNPNRCGFPVEISVVTNRERQNVTTLPDKTTITEIRGSLVLRFTNTATGTTIVRNVSGPTTETDYASGVGTFVGRGNNWFGFGPTGQGNTGEPGLVFTSGLVTVQLDNINHVATGFSLSGTQDNGCALLGG